MTDSLIWEYGESKELFAASKTPELKEFLSKLLKLRVFS